MKNFLMILCGIFATIACYIAERNNFAISLIFVFLLTFTILLIALLVKRENRKEKKIARKLKIEKNRILLAKLEEQEKEKEQEKEQKNCINTALYFSKPSLEDYNANLQRYEQRALELTKKGLSSLI